MIKNNTITIYKNVGWDEKTIDVPLFYNVDLNISDEENIFQTRDKYFRNLKIQDIKDCRYIGDTPYGGEIILNDYNLFNSNYLSFVNLLDNKTYFYFIKDVKINNVSSDTKFNITIMVDLDLWTTFHIDFFTSIKGSFVANRYTDTRYKKIDNKWYFNYDKDKDVWNVDNDNLNLTTYGFKSFLIDTKSHYILPKITTTKKTSIRFRSEKYKDITNAYILKNGKRLVKLVGKKDNKKDNFWNWTGEPIEENLELIKFTSNQFTDIEKISAKTINNFISKPFKYIAVNQSPYDSFEVVKQTGTPTTPTEKKVDILVNKNGSLPYCIKASDIPLNDDAGKNFINRINENDFITIDEVDIKDNDYQNLQNIIYIDNYINDNDIIMDDTLPDTYLKNLCWVPVEVDNQGYYVGTYRPILIYCYKLSLPSAFGKRYEIFTFTHSPFMKDTPAIVLRKIDDNNVEIYIESKTPENYDYDNDSFIVIRNGMIADKEIRINNYCLDKLMVQSLKEKVGQEIIDKSYEGIDKPKFIDISKDHYDYLLEPQIWMSHCYKTIIMRNGKQYDFYSELGSLGYFLIYSKIHMGGLYEKLILSDRTENIDPNDGSLKLNLLKTNYSFSFDNTKPSVSDSYKNYLTTNLSSLQTGLYGSEKNLEYQKKLGNMNILSSVGNMVVGGAGGAIGGMMMGGNPVSAAVGAVSGLFNGGLNIAKTKTQNDYNNFNADLQIKKIHAQQKDLFNSPDKILNGNNQSWEREITNRSNGYILDMGNYLNINYDTFSYYELPSVSTLKGYSDFLNRNGYLSGNQLYNMNINTMIKRENFNYWEIQDISTAIKEPKTNQIVLNYFRDKFNFGVRLWNVNKTNIKDYSKQNWDKGMK